MAWRDAAQQTGLALAVGGLAPLANFTLHTAEVQAARTLFTQLMLERGFLATNSLYANYAHSDDDIAQYVTAVQDAFGELARAIETGTVKQLLKGPVAHSGFYRLT